MTDRHGLRIGVAVLVGTALAFLFPFFYFTLLSQDANSEDSIAGQNIVYVLVNEDLGTMFNGVEYNLGAGFVSLVNQESNTLWNTASRSVATAGLANGAYDVKIILPQDFSKNLLSLQSSEPMRAQVLYELRPGHSDMTKVAILENVGLVLRSFSERVIQMYFSSILGNLYEAQRNIKAIAQGEQAVQTALESRVYIPFTNFPDSFVSVVSVSESLVVRNHSWEEQQKVFTEQVQEFLIETAEELLLQLDNMEEYRLLQEQIGILNLTNAQSAIELQALTDEEHYRIFFDATHETTNTYIDGFLSEDADAAHIGIMQNLINGRNRIADDQSGRIGALVAMAELIDEQIVSLAILRGDIAETFFGSRELTPETVTEEDIRAAIPSLIVDPNTETTSIASAYFARLHTDICGLAIDDLKETLPVLQESGLITSEQLVEYQQAFNIIERYISETPDVSSDVSHQFILVDTELVSELSDLSDIDFPLLIKQLQLLDRITGQIIVIFGAASGSGLTVGGFYSSLPSESSETIIENAAPDSVYLKYANPSQSELSEAVADSLVDIFFEQGSAIWYDVDGHYHALIDARNGGDSFETLEEIITGLPTADMLAEEIHELLTWHEEMKAALSEEYAQWESNPIVLLDIVEYYQHSNAIEGDTYLYFDPVGGSYLFDNLAFLSERSALFAQTTGDAAADIQSLEEHFSSLTVYAEEAHANAEAIIDDMGSLLYEFAPQVGANLTYADNFASVLSNARIGGADNPDVLSFLANPIQSVRSDGDSDTTVPVRRNTLILFAFVPMTFVIGMVLGWRVRLVSRRGKRGVER